MAVAKWVGVLSTTEPRNDVGIIKVRQGNINSEIAEFQIVQNNMPYDLTGLTVYFCASFGLNLVEKPAVVVNNTGGRIQYTFDDDSMQSVGRQKGYFSIKKEESKIDSTQDFEFQVDSSLMSRSIDGKSYIFKLDFLLKLLEDYVENGQENFDTWFDSIKEILYGVDPGGNVLRELIEAREMESGRKFTNLKERLDYFDTQNARMESKKADITYVDTMISQSTNGAIKGSYPTLNDLKVAYPNGVNTGPFLINEDSNRYIWDINKLSWISIGRYEPAEIADGAVNEKKTTFVDRSQTDDDTIYDLYTNVTLSIEGAFYDVDTGKLINNDYTQVYKNTGSLIINKKATYKVKCINSIVFYDATGKFISSWLYNNGETGDVFNFQKLPIPSNAVRMIGNINNQFWRTSPAPNGKPSLIETISPLVMKDLKIYNGNLSQEVKESMGSAKIENRFKGKIIVNFGDSIIDNKNPSVSDFIAADLGATVINAGFSGCMMCPHPNAEYAKFSMTAIADAVASGDWTLQENATGVPASFKATVAILKKIDWTKVSFITISYGTNDWLNSNLLDDTVNKFNKAAYLGASRYSLKTIMQKYPYLKVLITPPIFRSTNDRTENSDNWKNGKNIYMKDYADGLIIMGKELKIPVADTFYGLGINGWNESYYFPANDGTHPNAFGRELLGQKIANLIRNAY